MDKLFDAVGSSLKGVLEQLFVTNPTAAAWAIGFFAALYGMLKLALYTRALQEKLDAAGVARELALQDHQNTSDAKIAAKDKEIAVLNEKFHEHAQLSINVFNTVNNTLKRTNTKPHILQLHSGLQALCIHSGMQPHQINMQVVDDSNQTG